MANNANMEAVQKNFPVNISLAILMGLPASGKSTLSKKIIAEYSHREIIVIAVTFDEFVPHAVQAKSASMSENSVSKLLRKNFVKCVEFIVKELGKPNVFWGNCDSVSSLEETLLSPNEQQSGLVSKSDFVAKTIDILKHLKETLPKQVNSFVLLVDDNNYYTSMRNEFFQIAKTQRIGFCILYCKSSVRTCRKRNSEREEQYQVPEKSIVEMSLKLEEPNPMESSCDAFCVQIVEKEGEEDNIPLVVDVINNSIKYPVNWSPPPDRSEEIAHERRICSENEIHQADQVLRKWINKELILASFVTQKPDGESKNCKRELSKDLNKRKSIVLEKLRNGEFKMLALVTQDIEFREEVIQLARSIIVE